MLHKNVFKSLMLILLCLTISGCSISFGTGNGESSLNDGGVYKTTNKGGNWQQKILIPTVSGRPRSIGGVNVRSFAMDPSDKEAIYLGSYDNGLFYSYTGGSSWQIATSLGKVTISAVAIDPDSKCIIYAAVDNKLYKSTDCNRNWSQVYFDNDLEVTINALAIDNYNSSNVYIGTSRGEIIKSSDRGGSWRVLNRFEDGVEKIVINSSDTRIIFVATATEGLFRSDDRGGNWLDLSEKLKEFKDSTKFRDLVIAESGSGEIFLATRYGLLKSADYGDSWVKIELITPEKEATINAVAVNPEDSQEIYYITNTTFYHSLDGGQNWTTKKLPTTRAGWRLLIDPEEVGTIYLGVRKIK